MRKLLAFALLLGTGSLLSACSDRDGTAAPCDCPDIGGPAKWNTWYEPPVSGPDLSYHQPSYNPANARELVYRRSSRAELSRRVQPVATVGLWTGSAIGGQQSPLVRGYDILFDPNFGPNGWVAYTRGGQIWKAKTNGDSLQQLTFRAGPHYTARWSRDGTRLVCQQPEGPTGNHLIMDKDGTTIRALRLVNTRFALAWSPDGNSLLIEHDPTGHDMSLATYDLRTDRLETVVVIPKAKNASGAVYGAAWLPDGKSIVWCCDQGLYKTELATRRTVRLRSSCQGRRYENPAVSPDGRQLAVERTDQRVSDDGYSMRTEINIWTLDLDGRNEQQVKF